MGAAKTTGWEALDKWVGGSGAAPASTGAAAKTGWEALGKWVSDGSDAAKETTTGATAQASATAKTGWESLNKWVKGDEGSDGSGDAAAQPAPAEPQATTSDAPAPPAQQQEDGGGFMGWLRRLFGGG